MYATFTTDVVDPALLVGYLDHPTTAPCRAPGVISSMVEVLAAGPASPHRASHRHSRHAEAILSSVRELVAAAFGAGSSHCVIFTSGATMAINLAIKGLLRPPDHAVATCFDHLAVLRPLAQLRDIGCKLTIVSEPDPRRLVAAIFREVRPTTRLVAVTHASNVTGVVLPVEQICREARNRGVPVLVDAAQTAGVLPVDVGGLGADFVAFGGHKGLLGPPGVGCLVCGASAPPLRPLVAGSTGFASESLDPQVVLPSSHEAGTLNLPAIAGLGAAINFGATNEAASLRDLAARLRELCVERLAAIDGVQLQGVFSDLPAVPIVSLSLDGVLPETLAGALDGVHGISTRAGLHCAPLAHTAIGTHPHGTLRAGFGYGSTERSVERLCKALAEIRSATP